MEGEARGATIPHVNALDGARGVAVAGVLLFHGGHLLGGYLGVDFFFTLSGFLITSLLLAESTRTGSIGLGGFWSRRARRLLPALVVLMVGIVLYDWAFASPEQLGQIRGDAFSTLGYVANWHQVFSNRDYFALFTSPSPLNHTWSLAIEEQFYVVWPLVFVGLLAWWKRAIARAVLVTALALAVVSATFMIATYRAANTARLYFGTDTRAAAILLGAALAACLALRGPVRSNRARVTLEALGIVGALGLAVAWTRLDGESATLYRGGFLLCGLAATAIIAAAVHPRPGVLARVLSWKPLTALGLVSYGVYLYHWPIDVAFDSKQMGFSGWPLFAFQTALTLVVAYASYRFIEQPIRRGALPSFQWRRLTPAIAIGVVAVVFVSTTGAKSRFALATYGHPLLAASQAYDRAPPGSTRILVAGDSVALLLGRSFSALRAKPPIAVYDAGVPACTFPPEIKGKIVRIPGGAALAQTPCHPSWEVGVVNRFRPNIVFWVVANPGGSGGTYLGKPAEPCSPTYDALYERSMADELARLGAHGAKVVVVTSAYTRDLGHIDDHVTDCENRLRRAVAKRAGVQLVDLFAYVCPQGHCRVEEHGVKLRPDGLHYDGAGGRLVAKWLLDQVR